MDMHTEPNYRYTLAFNAIEGDPDLARIIKILRDEREKNEEEDLDNHIEAARSIA